MDYHVHHRFIGPAFLSETLISMVRIVNSVENFDPPKKKHYS